MRPDPFRIIGSVIDGRYLVEHLAGEGGFGVVYRAHHLAFESPIALKVLKLPEHWPSDTKRKRIESFQREGRMLFRLSQLHPSIVRAFETGTITTFDGAVAPYLALEWLEGVSLSEELKYRRDHGLQPMSVRQVLGLLHAPALGLARAHAEGVVHRDIKPANLFVGFQAGEPVVKILDFGIAKVIEESTSSMPSQPGSSQLTSSFTPPYAAPEQWLPALGPTSTRTDVHAWALVCVQLLTGKAPLAGNERAQLMAACLNPRVRPTPRAHGLELPAAVEAVFACALARDPKDRFSNVGAFWTSLCQAAAWSPEQRSTLVQIKALRMPVQSTQDPIGMGRAATTVAATAPRWSATVVDAEQLRRRSSSRFRHYAALAICGSVLVFTVAAFKGILAPPRPALMGSGRPAAAASLTALAAAQPEAAPPRTASIVPIVPIVDVTALPISAPGDTPATSRGKARSKRQRGSTGEGASFVTTSDQAWHEKQDLVIVDPWE